MAKKPSHPVTWAELGIMNSNFLVTIRALRFALAWGLVTAELGREPETMEEFVEHGIDSRATAFRGQQAFRKAFPTEVSPLGMNDTSGAQERYDEFYRTVTNKVKRVKDAQAVMFMVGSSPARA